MKRIIVETILVQSEEITRVGLHEACQLCHVEIEFLYALIEEGALETVGEEPILDRSQLARLRKAARLHHDLGVNPPGIALVLDLMDQL